MLNRDDCVAVVVVAVVAAAAVVLLLPLRHPSASCQQSLFGGGTTRVCQLRRCTTGTLALASCSAPLAGRPVRARLLRKRPDNDSGEPLG
jgi:hypothetical protein